MTTSRDQMLARIRAAIRTGAAPTAPDRPAPLPDRPAPAPDHPARWPDRAATGADAAYAALPRGYLRAHHDPAVGGIVDLFAERAADYRAVVERVPGSGLPAAIARALARSGSAAPDVPFVVPDGLPPDWLAELPAGLRLIRDTPPLSPAELDQTAGVVTGCAVAIAETGTIILDHGPAQGRRALTLVPDFHLVIVRADQVTADLPDAFARLDPARPHTLISGPSATSDIELIRVEGVHGPRNLHVLLVA